MSSEIPKFGIRGETTGIVMIGVHEHGDSLEFAKSVFERAIDDQPALSFFIIETAHEQGEYEAAYGIAASLSYAVVTTELRSQNFSLDLTEEDIVAHKNISDSFFNDPRWNDEMWVWERTIQRDGVEADSHIGYFLNIVDSVAPEFAQLITEVTVRLPDGRPQTLRGFYDGFMPFYTKYKKNVEKEQHP